MSLTPEQIAKAQEYNPTIEGVRWKRADLPEPLAGLAVESPDFAEAVAALQVEEELYEDGKLGPRTWQALTERRIEEEVTREQKSPMDLGFWMQGAAWPAAAVLGEVKLPLDESFDAYIDRMGIPHFSAYELTRLPRWGRNVEPLREDWPRLIPALRLAEILRYELGGHPLLTLSGYRPRRYNKAIGGAKNSQHIQLRALHLSLDAEQSSDEAMQRRLFEVAARLFSAYGVELKMGLGFYAAKRGTTVSLDTGFALRSWESQHVKSVLTELGLPYPASP